MEPSFPIERARLGMTYYWGFLYDALLIGYGWALKYKLPLPVPLTLCFMSK
jgi:hypothetical protein